MKTRLLLILLIFFTKITFGQFITTWETTGDNQTIIIPTNPDFTYDYNIDWGDGNTSTNQTGDATHSFAVKGTYTVTITGTFPAIYFNSLGPFNQTLETNRKRIKTVSQWGNNIWLSMYRAFSGCSNLTITATDAPNLSNTTNMSQMFYNATSVNPDVSGWNVSNVTNMRSLFYRARNFNQDVSSWNVANVTDMSFMFYSASKFNQDISSWNVSKVTDMSFMFTFAASFNQNIGSWNVENVTNMSNMLKGALAFNQNLGALNISKVTDMQDLFTNTAISIENYDAILSGWAAKTVKSDVNLGARGLKYCASETARTALTSAPNNWTIVDDGKDCSTSNYTAIPDPKFEQYLIQNGIDTDGQINGQVATSNITGVTQLDLRHQSISDLTGIQNFTALTYLNLFDNNLTSINVSQNTLLQHLYLSDNQLTTIDISNNINLIEFLISQNQLTVLDVSNNTKLTHLSFSLNQISTINVSNQSNLESLSCANNNLSSIDVSNNVNLESLTISKNKLSELDVSKNLKLKHLGANENELTSLDLSKNVDLLTVVCWLNKLTTLNIKNGTNTNIQDFESQQNPDLLCIKVDDANYSANNSSWTKDSKSTFLETCGEGTYIPDVNFETHIESLGLGNSIVGDGYVDTQKINTVTTLDISNKNISDLTGLDEFVALTDLNARDNSISNINLSKLVNLEKLDIFSNSLTAIDVSKNTLLKELHIGANQLTALDVSVLTNLTKLWCFNNQISELNVVYNTKLEVLNCGSNQLKELNLYSNKELSVLYCSNNKIKNLDVSINTKLTELTVDSNELESLNVKNGNNTNMHTFLSTSNSNLNCIKVDDASWSTTNWTHIDTTSSFNENCTPYNNDCNNAIPLIYGQTTPGDVNNGSANNNPSCATGNILADVWFSVIVPQSGEFSIEGTGFGGQLKFAVYTNCTSTAAIACGSAISLKNLTAGTKFYLKVWIEASSNRNNNAGTFTLTASESSVLSVKENDFNKKISLYPNPARTSLNISLKNSNDYIKEIAFLNLIGQQVYKKQIDRKKTMVINTSLIKKGVYIIRVKGEKQTHVQKIIIN